MPSNLPSSFASAAAGQNSNRDSRGAGRSEGRGSSGEWSRRDGRSTNGTMTFRRSSNTPFSQSNSSLGLPDMLSESNQSPAAGGGLANYDTPTSTRFDKNNILEQYKAEHDTNSPEPDPQSLFSRDWHPGHVNGSSGRAWGKPSEATGSQDLSVCWEDVGSMQPPSLQEPSPEEKEMLATDVNSTMKPPQQNKEGHQGGGPNGRKTSVSHGGGNQFGGLASPTSTRPPQRRRDTGDNGPSSGLMSPTGASRFARGDSWLAGRSTETKDVPMEEQEEASRESSGAAQALHFGSLSRNNTSASAAFSSAAVLWGASGPTSASSAGGMGSFGNFALPSPNLDKRLGSTHSRLAHLLPKDSSENISGRPADNANPGLNQSWRRPRTDTDPFGDEGISGSAGLGGASDNSPPPLSQHTQPAAFETPMKGTAADFGMSGLDLGHPQDAMPTSPSQTNPYRSPPAERGDGNDESGRDHQQVFGAGSEQPSTFSGLPRNFAGNAFDGSDRSQTSSVGAGARAYPSLNTLAGGWPTSGTPDRERAGIPNTFGSSVFGGFGDLASPSVHGFGGGVFGGTPVGAAIGSHGRGSKLASMFPAQMQAQMQENERDSLVDSSYPDIPGTNPLGAIGRGPIGSRDTDSPLRSGRGIFDALLNPASEQGSPGLFHTAETGHPAATSTVFPSSFATATSGLPALATGSTTDPARLRQMVLPDRMRWVYLDPHGQIQGPFTGLEMNDWYKANFFTPDLRVRRVEDPDFEPLGQLIRRIGNSREPFLVPQRGIAHGPPTQQAPFSPGTTGGGVIPPLSSAFPAYGRTLTAEEQNNLERRKQEEQQMLAQRQRDVLSQFKMPGMLQHQSSAHSLQSQPSFGSIASPIGMASQAPQPPQPPPASFYETMNTAPPGPPANFQEAMASNQDLFRHEFSAQERQLLGNLQQQQGPLANLLGQQTSEMSSADSSGRSQLPTLDQLQPDNQGFSERIREFHNLRAQREADEAANGALAAGSDADAHTIDGAVEESKAGAHSTSRADTDRTLADSEAMKEEEQQQQQQSKDETSASLSLTQQVQQAQAAAAAAKQAVKLTNESAWGRPSTVGMPMPFPPPQSSTPLPAPMAQRAGAKLPDQFSRSASGTPETGPGASSSPPPPAPWAGAANQKGPSLKDIQEAEAKKAAKVERAEKARKQHMVEQEAAQIREREKAALAGNNGLPTSSIWGTSSPVGTASSPWAKPASAKAAPGLPGPSAAATASNKKTLADIQREEEARKKKAAKDVPVQSGAPAPSAATKSYANLAGKPSIPPGFPGANAGPGGPGPATGSGWSTVGAGGKVKIPTGPAAATRSVSSGNVKPPVAPQVAKAAPKPAPPAAAAPTGKKDEAMDEFKKWVCKELSKGLNGDVNTFAAGLLELPLEKDMIADAVYANSSTLSGNYFAEEFIRRKKLADKGFVSSQTSGPELPAASKNGTGGWNEVAKKGGNQGKDQGDGTQSVGYKIVPTRKKGKK